MSKHDIDEVLWAQADQEITEEWYMNCSYCDRPSISALDKMVEERFNELKEESCL